MEQSKLSHKEVQERIKKRLRRYLQQFGISLELEKINDFFEKRIGIGS